MNASRQQNLTGLDTALLDLRRLTEAPGGRPSLTHDNKPIEVSTMLVVETVTRHERAGASCSIGQVAEALHVTHSTASRLVDRAVKAGMVARGRDEEDPRRTRLSLTASGAHLQREAVGFRTGRLDRALSTWTNEEIALFRGLLERFARDTRPLSGPGREPS